MITVTVHTFAALKDLIGAEFELEVAGGVDVEALKKAIMSKYPKSEAVLDQCRFAINEELVALSTGLEENQHVYILPPSSGG